MDCSFLIKDNNVQVHNGIAYNTELNRLYLNGLKSEGVLNSIFFLELSDHCDAIMVDFHGNREPNHIEIEVYINGNLPQEYYLGYSWTGKPCSLKLTEQKYAFLKEELMKYTY